MSIICDWCEGDIKGEEVPERHTSKFDGTHYDFHTECVDQIQNIPLGPEEVRHAVEVFNE